MIATARIAKIHQETPTVKSFLLELVDGDVPFKPGQWVDFYIDDLAISSRMIVGGFSVTSSPRHRGAIELAIKRIPLGEASVYLHDVAKVGDLFTVDGGYGECYFEENTAKSVVLVAGGIGITPMMSIVRYIDQAESPVDLTLVYSIKTTSESLFIDELQSISVRNPLINCLFTVTQPDGEEWTGLTGRIDLEMLRDARLKKDADYYICGPRGMPTGISEDLVKIGIDPARIKSEDW